MRLASSQSSAALYTSVLATVSAHFQVSVDAILGPRRTAHEVASRQICCAILATLGECPSSIGRRLGRDHSTVVHSLATVARKPELGQIQAMILASLPPVALLRLPNLTLDQALATLLGSTPPEDARAIQRFLAADILGRGARPDQVLSRVRGAYYLAAHPGLRTHLQSVLRHFVGQSAAQALAVYTDRLTQESNPTHRPRLWSH